MRNQWYLGFGASESLYQLNLAYNQSLVSGSESVQAEKLYELLSEFTDECLDQYFLSPIEQIQLNSVSKKIVVGGVSAIKKTLHLTLKQVIKKLSAGDRQQLAGYLEGLMVKLRESERYPTYIAVPITDDLRQRLREPLEKGLENPAAVVDSYGQAVSELIETAIDAYMNEPIRMLKMGMVMNKIATLASDTVRSATQTMVKKTLHSMHEKELRHFFEFTESILYQKPRA